MATIVNQVKHSKNIYVFTSWEGLMGYGFSTMLAGIIVPRLRDFSA
jgi:hypothetical protein